MRNLQKYDLRCFQTGWHGWSFSRDMKLENEFAPTNNSKNGLDITFLFDEVILKYLGTYKYS